MADDHEFPASVTVAAHPRTPPSRDWMGGFCDAGPLMRGEVVTMPDGAKWFHPFTGAAPYRL